MAPPTIGTIETLSLRAWPALEQVRYDGWLLRFANGYSKRANSVNSLDPGRLDVPAKIDYCARMYRERGLRLIFRLTPLAQPASLDAQLAARVFSYQEVTSVQLLDLAALLLRPTGPVEMWSELSPDWWAAFGQVSAVPPNQTHQDILTRISPTHYFALLLKEDRPVACGLVVLEDGCAGLFDIITAKAEQRKGYGRELVTNLLAWALEQGARWAYLQVLANNEPALNLYSGLGFREIYRYWYRLQEG